jgi:hypothetical protein
MVAGFQHGLIRLDVVLVTLVFMAAGFTLAAVWLRLGVAVRRRAYESVALCAVTAAIVAACSLAAGSWDTSESRINSFAEADEEALERVRSPLSVEVHLAPEDPRRADLDHNAIAKLRRVLPKVQVRYVSATSIGLFEQTSPHYGEIWYEIGGRREMTRATTAESALETIYRLADVAPPLENEAAMFRGHPLAVPPRGAAAVFYGVWPALVVAGAVFVHRRQR